MNNDHNIYLKAKQELIDKCLEKGFSVENVLDNMIESHKYFCKFNMCGECYDKNRHHLLFDRESLEKNYGKSTLKCNELCNNSHCGYVNRLIINYLLYLQNNKSI